MPKSKCPCHGSKCKLKIFSKSVLLALFENLQLLPPNPPNPLPLKNQVMKYTLKKELFMLLMHNGKIINKLLEQDMRKNYKNQ